MSESERSINREVALATDRYLCGSFAIAQDDMEMLAMDPSTPGASHPPLRMT